MAPRKSWPLVRIASRDDGEESRYYADRKEAVTTVEESSVHSSGTEVTQIIGSSDIFDEYGNIKLIPVGGFRHGLGKLCCAPC